MTISVSAKHKVGNFHLDVNFTIASKGVTALFGPSGSGKSLTNHILAGLTKPDKGEIYNADRVLFSSASGTNIDAKHRNIGYVFQDSRLFPHMKVEKNLLYGAKRVSNRPDNQQINAIVDLLDIRHILKRYPAHLSGGERQRVAIGRALLSNPSMLLLDEPLAALDHVRKEEILKLLERIRYESEIPILFISHSIDEVTRLADRIVLINKGKIVDEGPVSEIVNKHDHAPLTGHYDATNHFQAMISEQLPDKGLTILTLGENNMLVPQIPGEPGTKLQLKINAQDILLALEKPLHATSALNIVPAKIKCWQSLENFKTDIQLELLTKDPLEKMLLVARIHDLAFQNLELNTNTTCYATFDKIVIERTL